MKAAHVTHNTSPISFTHYRSLNYCRYAIFIILFSDSRADRRVRKESF